MREYMCALLLSMRCLVGRRVCQCSCNGRRQPTPHRSRSRRDGLGECDAVRAAVAFYHDCGQSHHAGAVVAARIEHGPDSPQHRAG